MSIFLLFKLLVFILPKKKKVGKMTIFALKPWVYPFEKITISRLFELLVFIA